MKLTALPADKGDCLLLESRDGKRVLVDGGMRRSYSAYTGPALAELGVDALDLVYVSHVDNDHITGILQLMDDLVAWRVYDHQVRKHHPNPRKPASPRPPEVAAIWHNAFREMVGENAGPIQAVLSATAAILAGDDDFRALAEEHADLATGTGEAIRLSRRVAAAQLGIPLNQEFGGKLMRVHDSMPAPIALGSLAFSVLAPFDEDLLKLRDEWNAWLTAQSAQLKRIQARARTDEERLAANGVELVVRVTAAQARELGRLLIEAAARGRRANVTTPNLASLMLLVEEDGRGVLLTGDGHYREILRGLKHHGRLDAEGRAHVDVLKIQHHGSEHNANLEFFRAITADQYVFCANGEHENPDLGILDDLFDSRLGGPEKRSPNAEATRPFKVWFNNSEASVLRDADALLAAGAGVAEKEKAARHMAKVEALVARRAQDAPDRVAHAFLGGPTRDWPAPPAWLDGAPAVALR